MNNVLMYRKMILGASATITSFYLTLAPHTVLLEKYKSFVARYIFSHEVPVQEAVRDRIREVMVEMEVDPEVQELIKSFSVFGFDIYHIGTSAKPYGAYIGIPANFEFFDINYVDKDKILLEGEAIDWNEKSAIQFLESLVLSKEAQKYAIAREILSIQKNNPVIHGTIASALVMLFYVSYNIAYYELKLYEARPLYRRMIIAFLCIFVTGCWVTIKDRYNCYTDAEIDKSVSELGFKYILGGQEFYEKLMQRNIALRNLLGVLAEKQFATNGNETSLLRQKGMSLSHRKSFFDAKLKDVQQLV